MYKMHIGMCTNNEIMKATSTLEAKYSRMG